MAVLGIIAEFNPFHNGHYNLIKEVRKQHDFDSIICVMSGSFVQRGEPAICNKWARAQMALQGGADLVIELPFCFATRSAYYFAKGALQLLELTGVVTHLAFGSENNDIQVLDQVADLLHDESDEYKIILKEFLAQGLSYPLARSKALQKYCPDNPAMASLLLGSNNILGIEYLKVLKELDSAIIPLTIERRGSSYHSTDLSEYASASAIRKALYNNTPLEEIQLAMPLATKQILGKEIEQGRAPSHIDTFDNLLLYKLRTMNAKEIGDLYDVTEGLEERIRDKALSCTNVEELKPAIKTKRYSLTKINRILLYSLFNLTKDLAVELDNNGPQYHHVLGFNTQGQKLLQDINYNSKIPVLNRGKDVKALYNQKDTPAGRMIHLDVMSTNVYNLLYPAYTQRIGAADFTTSPVREH